MKTGNWYLCNNCSGIIERDSKAKRIKSTCEESGNKPSILTKIENADKLAPILRKRFLKHIIELKSFTPKERMFLNMAWEQGAKVVFNRIIRKP